MTHPRLAQNGHGNKGTYSRFIPAVPAAKAKSGADLFNEGAPLSACETKNQVDEWLAAEAAEIAAYLAEEAAKTANREAFVAQVRSSNRTLQVSESKVKRDLDLARSLAYLDACQMEGMPASAACAVFC